MLVEVKFQNFSPKWNGDIKSPDPKKGGWGSGGPGSGSSWIEVSLSLEMSQSSFWGLATFPTSVEKVNNADYGHFFFTMGGGGVVVVVVDDLQSF